MTSIIIANRASARSGRVARYLQIGAVVGLGLALAGCGGIGRPGYDEFVTGNYQKAHEDFASDYASYPNSPVAQINMGESYRQRGEQDKANAMFHDAALSGQGIHPDGMSEPHNSNTTIADVACRYLAENHQSDPNCRVL